MITLDLTSGKVLRVNLENRDKEKPLRDAWYAMSDMLSYRNKELTIITDTHETHKFKVSDIKNCIHSEMIFKGVTGAEGPKPSIPTKESVKPKMSPTQKSVASDTDDAATTIKKMEDFLETYLKVLKSMPESNKRNMILFIDGVRKKDIPIDVSDSSIFEIASMAMRDEEIKVPYYIEMYCAHWKKHHSDFSG